MNSRKMQIWVLLAVISLSCAFCNASQQHGISSGQVVEACRKAADWQLENPNRRPFGDWTQGPFINGLFAISKMPGNERYLDEVIKIGEKEKWGVITTIHPANDHCTPQTWLDIYKTRKDPKMLGPIRKALDEYIKAAESLDDNLDFTKANRKKWSWCDALYMSPPTFARMYKLTGDKKYLDYMHKWWWKVSDYYYDTEEHLYYRDETFFKKREPNGSKVFWSRGNGWVVGGLVRVLQVLDTNDTLRPKYVTQFKEMCSRLADIQSDHGLWHPGLLDPEAHRQPETSGSAFFVYAMAYGINEGILDRDKFMPVINKAWAGLCRHLKDDGRFTGIQPVGDSPRKYNKNNTMPYGVGAFLLAGSEVYKLSTGIFKQSSRQTWRQVLVSGDYVSIAKAYADYMIAHGRDVYGEVHSPLFVTGMDRQSGKKITPPFPHVKRKPFMPGWERDRECRGSDRNYGQADPLDQLTLLKIMHRLTEMTGDKRYAAEANKTASWWMANTQTKIGLYPWGTHTYWNVDKDSGGGKFEFNHVWPYWNLNPQALQKYAMGLWDHYVKDKNTGDFNRHANSNRHEPGSGMEFPWPGSAMIATWTQAYMVNPDPEYVRAITTILKRWESLRDKNGHLAPCSNYKEWAWYGGGYTVAANRLDDYADMLEKQQPELAEKMRDYGRKCDAAYLKLADDLLDVKRVGIVKSYLRATGKYNPDRLDILGGPWQDRKDYAHLALLLYERVKRSDSQQLRQRYTQAVLDAAEVYMSINPEVQWSVWGVNMAHAIRLMMVAFDLTGNAAYLHRADHFGRLAVDLFVDEKSPLPKITSHDDFYEIESVTSPSGDLWVLAVLELHERLAKLDEKTRRPAKIATSSNLSNLKKATISGTNVDVWQQDMKEAITENRGGVWDCTGLSKPAASVSLAYGDSDEKVLLLSRREGGFKSTDGLPVDSLELIASDFINKIPTLDEAKPFNGPYRRKFSGKHREPSTAVYGGFKDVLDHSGMLMVNDGGKTAKVTVTATFHDSWDDRETKEYAYTLKPGERILVICKSPQKRFIRRLDFNCDAANSVKLKQFAFAMVPRSKLLGGAKRIEKKNQTALVFLIAGQSNAGGVAAFSHELNIKAGMGKSPTAPGSTAEEVGIPTTKEAYPKSYIFKPRKGPFERLTPGKNLQPCYRDPWRHGIELPVAQRLEKDFPDADKYFIKHGPAGHNLHTQWKARSGPDYKNFIGQYKLAMADLNERYEKVRVIGLYWDQGEGDYKKPLEYEKNLRELFTALREDIGIENLQIFVRKLIFQYNRKEFVPIIEAQQKITKEDANAHLLDLDLGSNEKNFKAWAWTKNNGHLSSKAYLELTKRIFSLK